MKCFTALKKDVPRHVEAAQKQLDILPYCYLLDNPGSVEVLIGQKPCNAFHLGEEGLLIRSRSAKGDAAP